MDTVLTQYRISYVKKLYDNPMFISYIIIRYNVYQYNNIKYDIASNDTYNIYHLIQYNTVINIDAIWYCNI